MSARIIPLPVQRDGDHGTIHIWGDRLEGFRVSHESRSGDSWGEVLGPFREGQAAITAAYQMNRERYDGLSDVHICDAARLDDNPGVGLPSYPGGQ